MINLHIIEETDEYRSSDCSQLYLWQSSLSNYQRYNNHSFFIDSNNLPYLTPMSLQSILILQENEVCNRSINKDNNDNTVIMIGDHLL